MAETVTGAIPTRARNARPRLTRPSVAHIALLVGLSLIVAGCGGGQKKHSAGTPTTTSSSTTRTAVAPKPIAVVSDITAAKPPIPFQVSIYDLRRAGPFLVLDFGVRCLNPNPGCSVISAFGPSYEPTGEIQYDGFTPSGIGLVDPTNLKEYLAVRDAHGRPYTSYFTQGDSKLTDSLVHLQWVRYAAPPPGTTALDVALPGGGPVVENVPITGGPAPTAGAQFQAAQPAEFAQPPDSTNTSGLSLPVENLTATSGNAAASDSESPGRAVLTLHSDVLFQFDKATLTPKARGILRSVAQEIRTRARGTVQVTGYTDSIGPDSVNIPLSQARARSVVAGLTPLTPGISYQAGGMGSADPVAPNTNPDGSDNPVGRALNRRVTIVFSATAARPTPPIQAGAAAGAPAQQAGSIAFPAWSDGNSTYSASNVSLQRKGAVLVLRMTLACTNAKVGNSCFTALDMAGTPTVPPQPDLGGQPGGLKNAQQEANTISGFSLLDPSTGTEYIPLTRTDAVPLTSNLQDSIRPGDPYRVWMYFPAPPSTTTSLTLVSPGGNARLGPIPITSAPATP